MDQSGSFNKLVEIMAKLRSKNGCEWDLKQTHESLLKYLREESFEVMEAVLSGDDSHLCEELGDLLLQVVFHAQVAKDRDAFNIDDVIENINHKLITRHPHVFKEGHVLEDSVEEQWEKIKQSEGKKEATDPFKDVATDLCALLKAERVQMLAAKDKFDWDNPEDVLEKIEEEVGEIRDAIKTGKRDEIALEVGDLLFSVVNLSRKMGFFPERDLDNATEKFMNRYRKMIDRASFDYPETAFKKLSLDEKEDLWQKIK